MSTMKNLEDVVQHCLDTYRKDVMNTVGYCFAEAHSPDVIARHLLDLGKVSRLIADPPQERLKQILIELNRLAEEIPS